MISDSHLVQFVHINRAVILGGTGKIASNIETTRVDMNEIIGFMANDESGNDRNFYKDRLRPKTEIRRWEKR